ncbi:MAG: TIGR02270 family protein [Candidatus Thiodiazotropha sp. (ex Ctena orbiculata)]|nr:TIGR02270 family protein [Candidatus Thiodiazotropha taylori]MBT2996655.1 TIGR02270 family protein [Candidatus Thiodiazotropha taylori]MBT3000695.1 TIGR02270 family protein [Candidatus Thiodiazotropha taylori]MBV2107024.1 TIGR02270 family protein [Candidatus Thiodiazotropha taylori]MBV2111037.1 TIGR02270 family protein [Candidatus Thiodiazotropha taylori]
MQSSIEHIVAQHAEESSFLWLLRDYAVREPNYNLADLKALEERIEAHLDGLLVADDAAWQFCESGLQQKESGEVFTATYVAIDNANQDQLDRVLETVAESPECMRGMVSALGWLQKDKLQGYVVNWLKSNEPLLRQIGLSTCAIQRVDCGSYLSLGLTDANDSVRARALRSVGELRRQDLLADVSEHLNSEDLSCRFWAAWSATLLGDIGGLSTLRAFFEMAGDFQQDALSLGLRAMDKASAVDWVRKHTNRSGYERAIIEATGIVGDPVTIPWLIPLFQKSEYARVAGEAFTMITGVDLAYEDLDSDQPIGFEAGPSERPEDEDVAMDPDEELPWPDYQRVSEWWSRNEAKFTEGERYLCGYPITRDSCLHVLKNGYQRQRRAAAIELALIDQSEPLFNCSAKARDQMRLLGSA